MSEENPIRRGGPQNIVGREEFGFTIEDIDPIREEVIRSRDSFKKSPPRSIYDTPESWAAELDMWEERVKAFESPDEKIFAEIEGIYDCILTLERKGTQREEIMNTLEETFPNIVGLYPLLRHSRDRVRWGYTLGQAIMTRQVNRPP